MLQNPIINMQRMLRHAATKKSIKSTFENGDQLRGMGALWFATICGALFHNITTAAFFNTRRYVAALRPLWLHQLQQWILTLLWTVLCNKSAKWLICATGMLFFCDGADGSNYSHYTEGAVQTQCYRRCKAIHVYLTEALTCTPSVH